MQCKAGFTLLQYESTRGARSPAMAVGLLVRGVASALLS
jgi:hypothetical protein